MFSKIVIGALFLPLISLTSVPTAAGRSRVDKAAKKINEVAPDQRVYFDVEEAAHDEKNRREATGSLWVDTYSARLYENMYRANKLGDTITIIVAENSQALGSGTTKTNRKLDHKASIDQLGGLMQKVMAIAANFDPTSILKAKTESKFQGDGQTERKGQLNARMTATVTDILQNGNLVIKGEQRIKMNKEEQVLVVEGIVRPYDVLPDNTVLSSSLANARISYSGFGVIGERQSPGWLVRVLDHVWPF